MNPEVLGVFATITSLAFMAMGLPTQIYKIYKAKSTEGVSLFERCTLLLTTVVWVWYGLTVRNQYIWIANAPGALCALIILWQFWIYRPSKTIRIQSVHVSRSEMEHIEKHGDIWLNRRMVYAPFPKEKLQAKYGTDTLTVSVTEAFLVGKSGDRNYRIHIQKSR